MRHRLTWLELVPLKQSANMIPLDSFERRLRPERDEHTANDSPRLHAAIPIIRESASLQRMQTVLIHGRLIDVFKNVYLPSIGPCYPNALGEEGWPH
jgi:hypothetical protein